MIKEKRGASMASTAPRLGFVMRLFSCPVKAIHRGFALRLFPAGDEAQSREAQAHHGVCGGLGHRGGVHGELEGYPIHVADLAEIGRVRAGANAPVLVGGEGRPVRVRAPVENVNEQGGSGVIREG